MADSFQSFTDPKTDAVESITAFLEKMALDIVGIIKYRFTDKRECAGTLIATYWFLSLQLVCMFLFLDCNCFFH